MTRIDIRILHNHDEVYRGVLSGPTELGRQYEGEPSPYRKLISGHRMRLIIAPPEELTISHSSLLIEPLPENRVRLRNLSSVVRFSVEDNVYHRITVSPGREFTIPLPMVVRLQHHQIELTTHTEQEFDEAHDDGVQQLPTPTVLPSYQESMRLLNRARHHFGAENSNWDVIIECLRSTMNVLQISAASDQFFQTAAEAAMGLVGLDSSYVLTHQDNGWKVCTMVCAEDDASSDWRASMRVLDRVRNEKRTFWKSNFDNAQETASLAGVTSVVAAPILNKQDEVIAVLYGDRRIKGMVNFGGDLTELDATLMELLACGIAAGLARVEQERAALEARTRFEEFFTPRLSRRLINDASLLQGQERNVTIMFCDVRRFSSITERLGPRVTVRLLNDIMGEISEAILQKDGVLVDYSGDAVMAMWGAPEDQPRHPQLACEAALTILESLPKMNERWKADGLGEQIDLSIGVNTGLAYVGNVGSHRKFKYGALGNTVNQASRIEGANKYFGSRLLISWKTLEGLSPDLIQHQTRCVGRVKVVNIEELVSLYELVPAGETGFPDRKFLLESFEESLADNRPEQAREILQDLLTRFPEDGVGRAYQAQLYEHDSQSNSEIQKDGSWLLQGK